MLYGGVFGRYVGCVMGLLVWWCNGCCGMFVIDWCIMCILNGFGFDCVECGLLVWVLCLVWCVCDSYVLECCVSWVICFV